MGAPKRVVISREDRTRVMREALRDDSTVRVTLDGRPRPRASSETAPAALGTPKMVVLSRGDRDRVMRAALLDDSKVRLYPQGLCSAASSAREPRPRP